VVRSHRDPAVDARTVELLQRTAGRSRTILIRGGIVVSMDPAIGILRGDVLLRDGKIAEVAPDLSAAGGPGTIPVDARGTIVMPGLVESHLHAWMGQLRGLAPTMNMASYLELFPGNLAHAYRPHDIYIGTLVSALTALDGGVTTIIDNFHNARSREHSNASVEAVLDAGIRAVHAAGPALSGDWERQWPADVLRLRDEYSRHPLVTFRLFDALPTAEVWQFAREHQLWMSHEMGGPYAANLPDLHAKGLLTAHHTFNHCFGVAVPTWALIADAGAQVNVDPRSDANFGLGPATPPVDEALRHGILPGLSMDNELQYGADMFIEMQTLLNGHRGRTFATNNAAGEDVAEHLSISQVLEFATRGSAANAGLADTIGSLTPGKDADLILISATDFNLAPFNDVLGTLVGFANRTNVDTVFVAGELVKWRGTLIGVDLDRIIATAQASRDHVLTARGFDASLVPLSALTSR
jgi:5-methylthioadenosine/S-adenosylhomocysteine deaminase